jgi:hypothetical protein
MLDEYQDKAYSFMSDEEKEASARDMALRYFVDYRQNLPQELQTLSDTGIWIFPQFMIKIQRVIASLLKTKMLTSGINVGIATMAGEVDNTIFASAVPFKEPASMLFNQYDDSMFKGDMFFPASAYGDVADAITAPF